jgi:glycosyltransferase involved in cell wall biosynthesis
MMLPQNSHVCFICPYIEAYLKPGSRKNVGGAQRQQHLLATRLREEGHTVSFISFERNGETYERIDGFDVWKTLPTTSDPVRGLETFVKLFRSIRRVDADVFYARGNPPLCILSSYCCSLLGKPLVYGVANDSNIELARLSSHHELFRYTLLKLLYLSAIRRADHVISQTDYQWSLLRDVFGIESTVIPNGYTVPPDDDVVPQSERSSVLWVGCLESNQKRPDRFLQLAESLPDVDFRMIGWSYSSDKAYREKIVQHADTLSNLTFTGFVPPDRIDQYYSRAVMLVNTSEYEGFPNTFLEAWRFGVPVVSLNHTLDGVLTEQGVGYYAGTMDELSRIVARLWNKRDEAAMTGRKGRQYMKDNYALDIVFEDYTQIFSNAMGRDGSRDRS